MLRPYSQAYTLVTTLRNKSEFLSAIVKFDQIYQALLHSTKVWQAIKIDHPAPMSSTIGKKNDPQKKRRQDLVQRNRDYTKEVNAKSENHISQAHIT